MRTMVRPLSDPFARDGAVSGTRPAPLVDRRIIRSPAWARKTAKVMYTGGTGRTAVKPAVLRCGPERTACRPEALMQRETLKAVIRT